MISKMKARGFCCSFCGRAKGEVANIMAGTPQRTRGVSKQTVAKSAFICDECVRYYYQMVTAGESSAPVTLPK